jgi:hypothetical protein
MSDNDDDDIILPMAPVKKRAASNELKTTKKPKRSAKEAPRGLLFTKEHLLNLGIHCLEYDNIKILPTNYHAYTMRPLAPNGHLDKSHYPKPSPK